MSQNGGIGKIDIKVIIRYIAFAFYTIELREIELFFFGIRCLCGDFDSFFLLFIGLYSDSNCFKKKLHSKA